MDGLRGIGYSGVMLAYAREFDVMQAQMNGGTEKMDLTKSREEIEAWKKGTLETVNLTEKGDFVALK